MEDPAPDLRAVAEALDRSFAASEGAHEAADAGDAFAVRERLDEAVRSAVAAFKASAQFGDDLSQTVARVLRIALVNRISLPASNPTEMRAIVDSSLQRVSALMPPHEAWLVRYQLTLQGLLTGGATFADYLDAIDNRLTAVDASGSAHDRCMAHLDAALAYLWLGDSERASEELRIAGDSQGRHPPESALPAAIALSFQRASLPTQAAQHVEEARMEATWRGQIEAELAGRRGCHHEAAEQYLNLVEPLGPDGASMFANAAAELTEAGEPQRALDILDRLEDGAAPAAPVLGIRADALLRLNRPRDAARMARRALAALEVAPDADLRWQLEWTLARALREFEPSAATDAYVTAAVSASVLRRAPLGYRLTSMSLKDKLDLFTQGVEVAYRSGRADACCRLIDFVKSRELLAILGTPPAEPIKDPVGAEFDRVTEQLDALWLKARLDVANTDQEFYAQLLSRRQHLLARKRRSDPRWRQLTAAPPLDLEATFRSLALRSQAAISMFVADRRIYSVLLFDGEASCDVITMDEETETALSKYQDNLTSSRPAQAGFDPVRYGLCADHLIAPRVLRAALEADSIVISPHRLLHALPWSIMQFEGDLLFQRVAVGLIPNISSLVSLDEPIERHPRLALFGAPTNRASNLEAPPGMRLELASLARDWRSRTMPPICLETEATRKHLLDLAASPGKGLIVHVATHAKIEPLEPMRSALIASDGLVDAQELSELPRMAAEVVLSACSTGWRPTDVNGASLVGDDILALPGAVFEAGGQSILVSIPPADDSATNEFIVQYYRSRMTGTLPLQALRSAQLAMLGLRPIYDWGGFVVYGSE